MIKNIITMFFVFCLVGCAKAENVIKINSDEEIAEAEGKSGKKRNPGNAIKKQNPSNAITKQNPSNGEKEFVYVEGNVSIKDPATGEWINVTEDTKLTDGSVIKLESDSFAEVNIGKTKKIKINEETLFIVIKKDEPTTLSIIYGAMKARIAKMTDEQMEIRTPVSIAGVRGTEFAVIYEEENLAEIEVYEGEVIVENITEVEDPAPIYLTKNRWAKVRAAEKPEIIGKITENKILRWKHLENKKELFLNLRDLKRIKMRKLRLSRKLQIEKDPLKKKNLENLIEKLTSRQQNLKRGLKEKSENIRRIRKRYRRIRKEKSQIRKNLIEKRRKIIIEERRRKIKDRRQKIKDRRQKIKDRK